MQGLGFAEVSAWGHSTGKKGISFENGAKKGEYTYSCINCDAVMLFEDYERSHLKLPYQIVNQECA